MYELDYTWELDGDVQLAGTARVTFEFHPNEDVDIIRVLCTSLEIRDDDDTRIFIAGDSVPIKLNPAAKVGLGRVIEKRDEERIMACCLERGREAQTVMARK